MRKNKINLDFNFSINEIVDINKSFALAKVAIAYAGKNRNQSVINKSAFEKALSTLKNIPVVGRYDETNDCFGGHDVKIVTKEDEIQCVNATTPFGVVPESANQYWENIVESDGTEHEYLFTDIILWKRQYGYDYLKKKGSIGQSMEISFDSYIVDKDNCCVIEDFEFEALCLIDCEPCFESASMQLSSGKEFTDYRLKFSQMLSDLKELASEQSIKLDFSKFNTQEGGIYKLTQERINEILAEYEIMLEDLDFEIDENMTEEDFRAKLDDFACKKKKKCSEDPEVENEDIEDVIDEEKENLKSELNVVKSQLEALQEEFEAYKNDYSTINSEVDELKTFKSNTLAEKRTADEAELFAKFDEKLNNDTDYETLKANCSEMSLNDISDKCFSILGKKLANFSASKPKANSIKLPVSNLNDGNDGDAKPYGDVYDKYLK